MKARGPGRNKGAAMQFAGAVLASLGLINTLFALKSGQGPEPIFMLLAAAGALLIAAGVRVCSRD